MKVHSPEGLRTDVPSYMLWDDERKDKYNNSNYKLQNYNLYSCL